MVFNFLHALHGNFCRNSFIANTTVVLCRFIGRRKTSYLPLQLKTFDTILRKNKNNWSSRAIAKYDVQNNTRRTNTKIRHIYLKTSNSSLKQGTIESFSIIKQTYRIKIGAKIAASLMKIADAVRLRKEWLIHNCS